MILTALILTKMGKKRVKTREWQIDIKDDNSNSWSKITTVHAKRMIIMMKMNGVLKSTFY